MRADPSDGISSGTQWFELFSRLRTLPAADRPTVYTVQGVLVAGVYAVGWGKLSRAFDLLSESITLSLDAGLHRSSDAYDIFDPIEDEIRRRTFWCVYVWDKQASAHFGRPPMIRLRDCDVGEPAAVDDEFITHEGIGPQPQDTPSRMGAFVCVLRLFVVLESVLDTPPPKSFGAGDAFLSRATSILVGFRRHKGLREEEGLLEEACASVPVHWRRTPETAASTDVIRVTHAERIACLAAFVRMLIMRHRFSEMVAERAEVGEMEQGEGECQAMRVAHACALQIVSAHLQIATKGLMTYCACCYSSSYVVFMLTDGDEMSRWRACHSSAYAGWPHARRFPAQLSSRRASPTHRSCAQRAAVLRWAAAPIQQSVRVRPTLGRFNGRILPK